MVSAWFSQPELPLVVAIPGWWTAIRPQAGHHHWDSQSPRDGKLETPKRMVSPSQARVDLAMLCSPLGQATLLSWATHSEFGLRSKQLSHPQGRVLLRTEGTFS